MLSDIIHDFIFDLGYTAVTFVYISININLFFSRKKLKKIWICLCKKYKVICSVFSRKRYIYIYIKLGNVIDYLGVIKEFVKQRLTCFNFQIPFILISIAL